MESEGEMKSDRDITASVTIENAESLLAIAEIQARKLLTEAAVKEDIRHREIMEETQKNIIATIEKTVNGKIIKLQDSFNDYIKIDTAWKEKDKEWKDSAQPVVTVYKTTTLIGELFGKWFVKFVKAVIFLGAGVGAFAVIRNFFGIFGSGK